MIYCGSISTLLYIAACEILAKEPVTFVHYVDVTPGYPDTQEIEVIRKWVTFICETASIDFNFYVLKSKIKPTGEESVEDKLTNWIPYSRQLIELPDFTIAKGDTVTDGLLDEWSSITKDKPLNIIGHSAGSLNMIPALCGYSSPFITHLRAIRNMYFRHKIKNIFLYNGMGQQINKFLPWYMVNKVRLIDSVNVNRLCQRLAKELMSQYPLICEISRVKKNIILYAATLEVEDNDYQSYLENQIQKLPFPTDSVFVIKNHHRDPRNYCHYFSVLGLKTIPLSSLMWRWLPLEIILSANPEFRYMGCYSSSMVSVDASRRFVYMPAKDELVNFYNREYSALIKSLN